MLSNVTIPQKLTGEYGHMYISQTGTTFNQDLIGLNIVR